MSSALQFSSRARDRQFILVWPGDDIVELKFLGETICAPPADAVAVEKQGRYRFGSAKDAQGRAIPGTILLHDVYDQTDNGRIRSFNAEFFLIGEGKDGQGLLGVNEALVARGLMLVDDIAQVAEAKRVGREMWEEKQYLADTELISNEFIRRKNHAEKFPGIPVPRAMDDRSIAEAVERLKTYKSRATSSVSQDDLLTALGGQAPQQTLVGTSLSPMNATPAPQAPAPTTDTDEPSLDDVADKLMNYAEEKGVVLTKDEWKGLARRNATTMELVRQKLEKAGVEV